MSKEIYKNKTLDMIDVGKFANIVDVSGAGKDRQHLLDMGLLPGATIKVIKKAPMGDPIEIRLHNYELALRLSHAKNIEVSEANIYDFSCNKDCGNCAKKCSKASSVKKTTTSNKTSNAKLNNSFFVNDLNVSHPGLGESGLYHDKKKEKPLASDKIINFALAGNQNSGKTTLFNVLTGSNQHVGNFPGVTVEKKSGQIKNIRENTITDLPGVYSLSPYSNEELVTRDFILDEDVDCIINIADATCLERSLYLTMQLMELNKPIVLALNFMDELIDSGGAIYINQLEEALGIPVVAISAFKKEGIEELIDHALHIAKYQEKPKLLDYCSKDNLGGAIHRAIHAIMHVIEDHCAYAGIPKRFAAEKIAEGDKYIIDSLNLDSNENKLIEHILVQMEEESGLDRVCAIAEMRYSFILSETKDCIVRGSHNESRERTIKIDKILTGKYSGIPMFILIMCLVFFLTFNVFGAFFQDLLATGIDSLSALCENSMSAANVSPVMVSFVVDGLFKGLGSVVSFLPIIVIMFFFLSLLEDSGYIARVAFVMDKLLRKIGLSGRSIVPLLIGFGCSVPAVMSCRTLPSKKDRGLTILLIPFMSCSAKLPIYAFLSAAFFPDYAGIVMALMYFIGIIFGIVVALCVKGKSKPSPFIMELPDYRIPSTRNVLHLLWEKCRDFLKRAFTVILIATIIIWFLESFNIYISYVADANESMLASLSGLITPIFAPIGLGDWRIVTSLITGFMAKESVVSTMSVLYSGGFDIANYISVASAVSLLLFCLLYTPCIATIATIKHEYGWKYSIGIIVFQCVLAWVVSFVVYNIIVMMC